MALDSVHPKYQEMRPVWDKCRDVYKGEDHVKAQGAKYLPPTKGMRLDGYGARVAAGVVNTGQEAYDAYLLRSVMPDYFQDAVEVFMGLLHSQPPKIELPEAMEPLRERATQAGESLELLLRRINEEQLVTGRLGLLLDLPKNPDPAKPMPYIALYVAEAVTNWDDGEIDEGEAKLNLVVLDESGYRRTRFEWEWVSKFRVLELEPQFDGEGKVVGYGAYRQGVFDTEGGGAPDYVESDLIVPVLRSQQLDEIPFVFVNTKDTVASPDKPSLLGLVNAVLTIYRGEADYRQNLFMQGQDTLVVTGEIKGGNTDPNQLQSTRSVQTTTGIGNQLNDQPAVRLGTGSMIHLEQGGTAEMVGVSANGLSEQRTALENDRRRAETKSSSLSTSSADDGGASGEALKTRVGARTASLNSIAVTGAAALEWELKAAARWMGADESKVKVTANMEFADYQMSGQNLAQIVAAKIAGAPLSNESIHALMAEGGITKFSYQEEQELLDKEAADGPPPGTTAGGNPPPADPNAPPADQPGQGAPGAASSAGA